MPPGNGYSAWINYAKARPFWLRAEQRYTAESKQSKAIYARVSRLRGDSETILSYPAVSEEIAALLTTRLVQSDPELLLRCLVVKGAADLSSKDPVTSGRVWIEALQTAESLHDRFWMGRVSAELSVINFLKGDTARAIELIAQAFQIAQNLNDVQGEVRDKSLEGKCCEIGIEDEKRPTRH